MPTFISTVRICYIIVGKAQEFKYICTKHCNMTWSSWDGSLNPLPFHFFLVNPEVWIFTDNIGNNDFLISCFHSFNIVFINNFLIKGVKYQFYHQLTNIVLSVK